MFEFINPTLAFAGLGLMAVPVVIHLINLMRHRRVEWAAMEFLLESQRKNSTYVMLKQLLLLLMRMGAVAAVAMILGQLLMKSQWLGDGPTHHIVLVDDSYSMSDAAGDGRSAMDLARQAIRRLAVDAQMRTQQVVTLWRASQPKADVQQRAVGMDFANELTAHLGKLEPSDMTVGLEQSLERIQKEFGKAQGERRIVYLVSDFRKRDWSDPTELVKRLKELQGDAAEIVLVQCVEQARQNLGVVDVKIADKTHAVDLPIPVDVTIKNFGPSPAKNLVVDLLIDGVKSESTQIESIGAGDTATRTLEVKFATAGEHAIAFRIPADAVSADNKRTATLGVPLKVETLVIDGAPDLRDGTRLALMLAPGGGANTGLSPVVETPAALGARDLSKYASIYFCNVAFLSESVVQKLEKFVQEGGGVCFFVGEKTDAGWMNIGLYKKGEGLLPAPLGAPAELVIDRLNPAPDVQAMQHPMFKGLLGLTNSPLDGVLVNRYFALEPGWKPTPESRTTVAAQLRNGAPLVLEKSYGSGRSIVVLNPGREPWSNWHTNISFILALLDLQAYLNGGRSARTPYLAGSTIEYRFPAGQFSETVGIVEPGARDRFGQEAASAGDVAEMRQATKEDRSYAVSVPALRAGLYELKLSAVDGSTASRKFACNVNPEEGDLELVTQADLATNLKEVNYQVQAADKVQEVAGAANEQNFSEWFLYLLVVLLLGEQVFAYFCSYHPAAVGGKR